jgi:MATE family multidrug resistance protein
MSIQHAQHNAPLLETGDEPPEPPPELLEPEPTAAKPGFTLKGELWTMFMLGWPMVISFVCRIAMASTDTAFVGHLTNQTVGAFFDRPYTGEEYLAAASLSDMVVNVLVVPPLAFNQVLNALVGQAIGSGNKLMAGTWLQLSIFFLVLSYLPMMALQYFFVADAVCHTGLEPRTSKLTGFQAGLLLTRASLALGSCDCSASRRTCVTSRVTSLLAY